MSSIAEETQEKTQIDQAVEDYLQAQLRREASEHAWLEPRLSYQSSEAGYQDKRQPCVKPLQVTGEQDASLVRRQRLEVLCPDTAGWRTTLRVQGEVWLPVWSSSRVIERGDVLDADSITLQEHALSKLGRGYFQHADDVQGQRAKRRLRQGQAISPGLLDPALLVERGQRVKIIARHDGIEATTPGLALDDGALGQQVRVRNLSSDRVIETKVMRKGVVSSIF